MLWTYTTDENIASTENENFTFTLLSYKISSKYTEELVAKALWCGMQIRNVTWTRLSARNKISQLKKEWDAIEVYYTRQLRVSLSVIKILSSAAIWIIKWACRCGASEPTDLVSKPRPSEKREYVTLIGNDRGKREVCGRDKLNSYRFWIIDNISVFNGTNNRSIEHIGITIQSRRMPIRFRKHATNSWMLVRTWEKHKRLAQAESLNMLGLAWHTTPTARGIEENRLHNGQPFQLKCQYRKNDRLIQKSW